MEKIYRKPKARINLTLNIVSKREDNYHNLQSVFQKLTLCDEMTICKTHNNEFSLHVNVKEIEDEKNIVKKAYDEMKKMYPIIDGVDVTLNKQIPMQAGLAGGSTDCASFIFAINELFHLNLSTQELEKIGLKLGADVVPCMYDGAVKASGIGDIIERIDSKCELFVLIIKPKSSCNTKEMYLKIDTSKPINQTYNTDEMIYALEKNDIDLVCENIYNVFEEVLENKEEFIKIKEEFLKSGALASGLTGSGSCIYGIYRDEVSQEIAYEKLKSIYELYKCKSYNS